MNKVETVLQTIIDTIPQWYLGTVGSQAYSLSYDSTTVHFCCHRSLTPDLHKLYDFAEAQLPNWLSLMPTTPTPSALGKIREDLVLFWLSSQAPSVEWDKLLAYAEGLRFRTYENQPISLNLIVSSGVGTLDITQDSIQKIIDPLASSQNAFFRVDYSSRYINYEQVAWHETTEPSEYKFSPDFVQPFVSRLERNEFSFHLTARHDILILNRSGMLAAYRKGNWYIYSVYTFKNSITDITGNYRVGCNLFDLVFDLSYRRHGALLIYDPQHKVVDKIINKGSIIKPGATSDSARSMLRPAVYPIEMGNISYEKRKKRLLLEIAGIDGAVVFDDKNVLAFGAMIATHDDAGDLAGARTTAARSAYLYEGIPVKISSDGDISMLFLSKNRAGEKAEAMLKFM
ncbi:hypothetical protein [Nodosilinea sp. FACHB-13]|uniref:hypothetical protein n=1 Tax=Cyanophyceae TaxID=3028117 RepID=UPI001688B958|nr:hypothetical protein [Nodosilinea sp. FACHB-13]MBD2106770.1 hypothetical protein [Nodosilinea sp. FACHB-13]